jgi:hypothetical protein
MRSANCFNLTIHLQLFRMKRIHKLRDNANHSLYHNAVVSQDLENNNSDGSFFL